MNLKHCDICGVTEKQRTLESYKVQIQRGIFTKRWEYIDICTKCLRDMSEGNKIEDDNGN